MRAVLVTGASTGIGAATARRLDAAGWQVFAGVRRTGDGIAEVRRSKRVAIPAEKVAAVVERALSSARPQTRYRVGLDSHGLIGADRLLPAPVLDRVIEKVLG